MFVLYDNNLIVRAVTSYEVSISGYNITEVEDSVAIDLVGKILPQKFAPLVGIRDKENKTLRVAIISNWNDKCGISTYSQKLTKAMIPQVGNLKVFSEIGREKTGEDEDFIERCWTRGKPLHDLAEKVKEWNPDYVIVQHEFGLFPNGFFFMQLMESLKDIPYVVAMHSAYEHPDKAVYCEAAKNIIVHSKQGKAVLRKAGVTSPIHIVPHGCDYFEDKTELWNIFQNPYTIMQFGFGFEYKGVERALEAVAYLKKTDPKFKNIYYYYLCSSSNYNSAIHVDYYNKIQKMISSLDLKENVSIIPKYQTDHMINMHLRLAKIAVFPYVIREGNRVYGSSGAIRIAMANKRPVIASESNLFDDLEDIVPRPSNAIELAKEIDEIFSNDEYRKSIVEKSYQYTLNNSWSNSAAKYIETYHEIASKFYATE